MRVEVTFLAPGQTSGLHAAKAVAEGLALCDPHLAAAIYVPARQLAQEILTAGLPAQRFWQHLVALSATIHNRRELAQRAITKTSGNIARMDTAVATIAAAVAGVENAFRAALPNLD